MDPLKELLALVIEDPSTVHDVFFRHRHPQKSVAYHKQLLLDWYAPDSRLVQIVFRGGAKSTYGEEGCAILACTGAIKNGIIIGSSEARAKERLAAIKNEIETNPYILDTFGDMQGSTWQEAKLVLRNQTCLQALGWNQSMRGIKHLNWRPDFGWIDDVEDEDNSATPLNRAHVVRRLLATVIPAIDGPGARLRVTGSILDADGLVLNLKRIGWKTRIVPARHKHPLTGEWVATWPERKPLHELAQLERDFTSMGQKSTFDREYMCVAQAEEDKQFREEYFRFANVPRSYQSTFAIYDPARTTNQTSAHTGKVVASWEGSNLLIWESSGNFWKPDEIIQDIFRTDDTYHPIAIGVEKNGLDEFIMQPIRTEQVKRGHILPIRPLSAPKGKITFIQGLQVYFKAKEVIMIPDRAQHQTLIEQLLNFPTGKIDIPNALAYMLMMKVGVPVFDNFDHTMHVDPLAHILPRYPTILGMHTQGGYTVGVLFQLIRGSFVILNDWVLEGGTEVIKDLLQYAQTCAQARLSVIIPRSHFDAHDRIGVRPALARVPIRPAKGGDIAKGRETLRKAMASHVHGKPGLSVSPDALWTLRALQGGFARAADRRTGLLQAEPVENVYALVMDALCSAVETTTFEQEVDTSVKFAHTPDGTRYITAKR